MERGLTGAGLRRRRTQTGEGDRQWCGRKVVNGEGVDVDEIRARAILLEGVVGPEVHGHRQATVNSPRKRRRSKKRSSQRR
jgi:hypothetical protein